MILTREELYKLDPLVLTRGLLEFNEYIRKEFGNDDERKSNDDESTISSKQLYGE
jgi:hypothetical protein